ncbi:MAG: hypothetical protein SGI83_13320 [Bacteroidota bacterium]|nr:hypothetical protein [Bacteroidota bacterium]
MANQLILQQQKFKFSDITAGFPSTGNPKKKVFFQSELRSLANGDASFGVIAYPSWKDGNKWVVGNKIPGTAFGNPTILPFILPLAFANNEVLMSAKSSGKKRKKKRGVKGRWNGFQKLIQKKCGGKKLFEKMTLVFKAKISENPHIEYDVTLDFGNGTVINTATKPSPPAPPEA